MSTRFREEQWDLASPLRPFTSPFHVLQENRCPGGWTRPDQTRPDWTGPDQAASPRAPSSTHPPTGLLTVPGYCPSAPTHQPTAPGQCTPFRLPPPRSFRRTTLTSPPHFIDRLTVTQRGREGERENELVCSRLHCKMHCFLLKLKIICISDLF